MRIDLLYGSTYTTIDNDYITQLEQEASSFIGESFYVGSTVCRSFTLSIDRNALASLPDDGVIIYDDNNVKYADLVIDSIDDSDDKIYTFNLTDRMIRLNADDSSWYTSGDTVLTLIQSICTTFGIIAPSSIAQYGSTPISWFDNWTAREFVSWVAELLGGYAYISANNTLTFASYSSTLADTIAVSECDSFKLGEQITIDRVVYDSPSKTVVYPTTYTGTGCTLYLNTDNQLFTDSTDLGLSIDSQVQYIYNQINGFSFYNISVGKCPIDESVRAGQCIGFTLDGTTYNTIAQINWNYNTMWLGGYQLDIASPTQQETQIVNPLTKVSNAITQKIDREIGEITSVITDIQDDYDELASRVTTNETSIIQNANAIELKASESYVDSAVGEVEQRVTTLETSVVIDSSGLTLTQGTEGSYVQITDNGMQIFVDGQEQAYATAEGFKASTFITGDWHIQSANSGKSLNFFRRS